MYKKTPIEMRLPMKGPGKNRCFSYFILILKIIAYRADGTYSSYIPQRPAD